ncbi:hypothetical protein BDV39DRAFT_61323 [Aspergillus sergii]|uniref:Uncharacterized protein n=1 Tax=Aspergillus sergii TaxID=1034303 RepID=A0A5N6XBX4_9EURO|nr:hypothetical protein BDV39DRAFT_61323 [Aspergillus sergii]
MVLHIYTLPALCMSFSLRTFTGCPQAFLPLFETRSPLAIIGIHSIRAVSYLHLQHFSFSVSASSLPSSPLSFSTSPVAFVRFTFLRHHLGVHFILKSLYRQGSQRPHPYYSRIFGL